MAKTYPRFPRFPARTGFPQPCAFNGQAKSYNGRVFSMATAPLRWMTATKRSWPGSRAATSGRSARLPRRHVPAMLGACPPHPRQRRRRRGRGAGSHAAGLDPRAALAAAGAVPHLAHARRGQSLSRPQAPRALGRARSGRRHRRSLRSGAGDKAESDERERLVAAAIAELPARQRAAIVLTYGDGMSNAQVAEILDTSVSAVETLLVRGKQNLRRALGSVIDKDE